MGLASDVLITEFVVVQLATVSGYFDYKALNHLTIAWRALRACCRRIGCVIKSRIVKSRGASRDAQQCRVLGAARVGGRHAVAQLG